MEKALVLNGPSGLGGELLIGALVGLGASEELAQGLPARLGVKGEVAFERLDGDAGSEIRTVIRTRGWRRRSYRAMVEFLAGSGAPAEVIELALGILAERERALAEGRKLGRVRYREKEAASILIEVLGVAWLWHDLGVDRYRISGPLELGATPPQAIRRLIGRGVWTRNESKASELVTPTAAAALKVLPREQGRGQAGRRSRGHVIVHSGLSDQGLCPPLRARLVIGGSQSG